jgi:hypothetical protein
MTNVPYAEQSAQERPFGFTKARSSSFSREAEDPTPNMDMDLPLWLDDSDFSITPPDPNLPSLSIDAPFQIDELGHGKASHEYAFWHDIPSPVLSVGALEAPWQVAHHLSNQHGFTDAVDHWNELLS